MTDVNAKMLPTNVDPLPSVAELPICQNTLQAWAPLLKTTDEALAVMRVLPLLKINTALALP